MDPYICALIAFLILQIITVAGRVYVRTCLVKAFGKDDTSCLITLLIATAFDCCILALWPLSHLRAIGDFPSENLYPSVNLVLSALCLYIIGTMSLKISLGLLLLRVLVKRWMEIVIYVIMAISIAYGIAFFFVVLFQCGNPNMFVTRIVVGQCLPLPLINGLSYTHAVITALADMIYAALPVIFLWNAAFSRRAKLSVGAILVLGSAGCICTFIRIGWISTLTAPTTTYLITARNIGLLSAIELSIGLVCISLATYRPLLHRWIRRRSPSYYYDEDNSQGNTGFTSQHGPAEEMTTGGPRYTHTSMMSGHSKNKFSNDGTEHVWSPVAGSRYGDAASEKSVPWQGPSRR